MQVLHEQRGIVCPERLAVLLHIQQPVVLGVCIGEGIIDQIVSLGIIVEQQLFYRKVVAPGALDHGYAGEVQAVHQVRKLSVLVVPEQDAALVKLRQGRRKAGL